MSSDVWASFHKSPNVEDRRADPYVYDPKDIPEPSLEELMNTLGMFPPTSPLAQAAGVADLPLTLDDPIKKALMQTMTLDQATKVSKKGKK